MDLFLVALIYSLLVAAAYFGTFYVAMEICKMIREIRRLNNVKEKE